MQQLGKVDKVGTVGKVGKEGKEGRLQEQRLPSLYQILQQSNKNVEKSMNNFVVEVWKEFDLDTVPRRLFFTALQ